MSPVSNKIALFIDGANLYATAKTLGFDIDYKRLLKEFQSRGTLVRAFYYTAIIEDQEYSSIRPLIDWLDYNGYTVVTKATKEFIDASGRRKVKGNMDIELAVTREQHHLVDVLGELHGVHGELDLQVGLDRAAAGGVKGNRDIELAVNAMELAEHIDQMVLISG